MDGQPEALTTDNKDTIEMIRLSDFPINNNLSKINKKLDFFTPIITEIQYQTYQIKTFWGRNEFLIISLGFFTILLGSWDLGIGELSGGGDYNRSGLFGSESGFLQIEDFALILALLSSISWIGYFSLMWIYYPIMRENLVYLLLSSIIIQLGYIRSHAESPDFPVESSLSSIIYILVVNLIVFFLAGFVVHRAVLETRDIHVKQKHSHPDPRIFENGKLDHKLRIWTFSLILWVIFLNISSWSGSHSVSPSPGDLDFSYSLVIFYIITGLISMVLFLNIIWYPQFMLGSSEDSILSSRARVISGTIIVEEEFERGKCPVCNQETMARKDSDGLITIPCNSKDCDGSGEIGTKCEECGEEISSRIVCINCGSDSPVGSHFGRVDAW